MFSSFLKGLVIPSWVKLIPPILILLLMAALAWQTNQLKHRGEQLANEKTQRHEVAALVHADDNWQSIRIHIRDDQKTSENRKQALTAISKEATDAKTRADKLDLELKTTQADNDRKFAAAQHTIRDLQARKSSGNVATDAKTIDTDSQTAWKGWHRFDLTEVSPDYTHLQPRRVQTKFVVQFVVHPNEQTLKQSEASKFHFDVSKMDNIYLYGWSYMNPNGVCEIHTIDPKVEWNENKRNTMGHELAHCIYGSWHGDHF